MVRRLNYLTICDRMLSDPTTSCAHSASLSKWNMLPLLSLLPLLSFGMPTQTGLRATIDAPSAVLQHQSKLCCCMLHRRVTQSSAPAPQARTHQDVGRSSHPATQRRGAGVRWTSLVEKDGSCCRLLWRAPARVHTKCIGLRRGSTQGHRAGLLSAPTTQAPSSHFGHDSSRRVRRCCRGELRRPRSPGHPQAPAVPVPRHQVL